MFTVTVRDQMMIAHSLRGEVFGPAQGLHGATYVVEATFSAATLDRHGIVVDLGRAGDVLHEALADLNYANLDDLPELRGINTTTEMLAQLVADRLAQQLHAGALGPADHLHTVGVTLRESPTAWAGYTRRVNGP